MTEKIANITLLNGNQGKRVMTNEKQGMFLVTVTPEIAFDWLVMNLNNRPKSIGHIQHLANIIRKGEWRVNGESIKFNKLGELIDGQHRLEAVVEAERSITTYVLYGAEEDIYDTLDQGKKRSFGDALGRLGNKYANCLATTTRWLLVIKQGSAYPPKDMSIQSLHNYFDKNTDIILSVEFLHSYFKRMKGPMGPICALHCLFARINRDRANLFFHKVMTGENILQYSPEYLFREVLLERAQSTRKCSEEYICTAGIRCWNLSCTGRTLKNLRISLDDERPEILTPRG